MRTESIINERKSGIHIVNATFISLFHVGAVAALFFWSWQGLIAAVFFYWLAGSLGIGIGYHRLLTHRGFKTPKWVEYFLTVCGMLALQDGAINWVATHRIHHRHAEIPGKDPHTPREGGWWAHIGWIVTGRAQQYPDETLKRYAPDLWKDAVHRFLNRWYFMPLAMLSLALLFAFGWRIVLWGVFLRVTLALHATWLVNSATHLWGSRRFETGDDSRNNWWVALLTFGEGWHNNHHAYPRAARHGLAWYEIDFNWWGIRLLQFLGFAEGIKLIPLNFTSTQLQPIPVGASVADEGEAT